VTYGGDDDDDGLVDNNNALTTMASALKTSGDRYVRDRDYIPAILLCTFFVELINNNLLVMKIIKKRLRRPYLMGQGTETSVSCAKLFN
jgi:hypothetical protein